MALNKLGKVESKECLKFFTIINFNSFRIIYMVGNWNNCQNLWAFWNLRIFGFLVWELCISFIYIFWNVCWLYIFILHFRTLMQVLMWTLMIKTLSLIMTTPMKTGDNLKAAVNNQLLAVLKMLRFSWYSVELKWKL